MAHYSIGIDLGTTNSAVSWFNLDEGKPRGREQTMLPIPQVTARRHGRRKAAAAVVSLPAQRPGIPARQPGAAVG